MSLSDTFVDELESLLDAGVESLDEAMQEITQALGDRPIGFQKGTRLERLEHYLSGRDDPAFWSAVIAEESQIRGLAAAEVLVLRTARDMEAMLERAGGAEAVITAITAKRLSQSQKSLRRLEKLESMPKWMVNGPVHVPTLEEMLATSHSDA